MPTELDRELTHLEHEIKRLEAEYNMYFAGQLPRPPWETRSRVDALIKRYDRAYIQGYADRFRFRTLQARYVAFTELWERALRAREEGRPGPFSKPKPQEQKKPPQEEKRAAAPAKHGDRVLIVTTISDPATESDKLHELYQRIGEARREAGEDNPPFNKFAELVKAQVKRARQAGTSEVAFRVALKDGKVSFTARALRGAKREDSSS